jgi:excinuclease ABC subunit C
MTLKKINLEKINKLREKLKNTPENPGIYIHKNATQDVLYVGKAKNLYNRLHNYFYSFQSQNMKTQSLICQIHDFDFIVTKNEAEALILENNFIKHNRPPFNILLRDDKTYPYLKVNIKDQWPRVTLVRRKKSDDALYFGPYVEPGKLDTALTVIHKVLPHSEMHTLYF